MGAVLKHPPLKQVLASELIKARFPENLICSYIHLSSNRQVNH